MNEIRSIQTLRYRLRFHRVLEDEIENEESLCRDGNLRRKCDEQCLRCLRTDPLNLHVTLLTMISHGHASTEMSFRIKIHFGLCIQAGDLIGRKVLRVQGKTLSALLEDIAATAAGLSGELAGMGERLSAAAAAAGKAAEWVLANYADDPNMPGGVSYHFLMMLCRNFEIELEISLLSKTKPTTNKKGNS